MLRLDFRVTSIFCLHHALYKIHTWKLFAYGKIKSERETLVKKEKRKKKKIMSRQETNSFVKATGTGGAPRWRLDF